MTSTQNIGRIIINGEEFRLAPNATVSLQNNYAEINVDSWDKPIANYCFDRVLTIQGVLNTKRNYDLECLMDDLNYLRTELCEILDLASTTSDEMLIEAVQRLKEK